MSGPNQIIDELKRMRGEVTKEKHRTALSDAINLIKKLEKNNATQAATITGLLQEAGVVTP